MANFNSVYNFIASDKFTDVVNKIGKSSDNAAKKIDGLKQKVESSASSFDKLKKAGNNLKTLGDKMKWYSAAATGALGFSLMQWQEQEAAIARVGQTLKNTGSKAGFTAGQLNEMAGKISSKSLYGGSDILNDVTNKLVMFGNLHGKTFERAQQTTVNMAAALQIDLASAAQMVGKSLSSPARGVMMLQKAGIKLTPIQSGVIKKMTEMGKASEAQAYMMDILEEKFKNQAELMRNTQPIAAMRKSFSEFAESIGKVVAPVLIPLINGITSLLTKITEANPVVRYLAGGILLLVAVGAPLLLTLGAIMTAVPLIATALGGLASAFLAVRTAMIFMTMTPIGLMLTGIVVAIAAVIAGIVLLIKNWQKLKAVFTDWMPDIGDSRYGKITQESTNTNHNRMSGNIDVNVSSPKSLRTVVGTSSRGGVSLNRGRSM